jgi:hypothetical protein
MRSLIILSCIYLDPLCSLLLASPLVRVDDQKYKTARYMWQGRRIDVLGPLRGLTYEREGCFALTPYFFCCTDHIPYVEFGDCVAFNNEKGGVIEYLKDEKIVDLNSNHPNISSTTVLDTKAMVSSWLANALLYELWVVSDGSIANDIYFSDLPWPIGKILHWNKTRHVKQLLGITKLNAAEKEEEVCYSLPIIVLAFFCFLVDTLVACNAIFYLNRYT